MNTTLLILASIFAVVLSILSVQIPRYLEYHTTRQHNASKHSMTDGHTTPPRPSTWRFARKPWDPPFPTSSQSKQSQYMILPPISPTHIPTPNDGTNETEDKPQEELQALVPQNRKESQENWSIMSIVWTSLAIFAGILLIVAFTLLITHCLAWFIVYKTEARLGEARRGVVQGGEMRLCLCARG